MRLRPLSDHSPKPAIPLLDIPLGAFGLPPLVASTPTVVVNVRHLAERVTRSLAPFFGSEGQVEVFHEEPEAFGAGGTLAALRHRVGERLVTRNADVLSDLDPALLVAAHLAGGATATLATQTVSTGADLRVEWHEPTPRDGSERAGRAVEFYDRRREPGQPGARFLGMAVWERPALDLLSSERPLGLAALLRELVDRAELAVVDFTGYWLDVGTAGAYLQANLDLVAGTGPSPPGPWPGAFHEVAGGRAYVGPGARVGADALGPGAVVMAGARVGQGAYLEDAVVWPRELVPAGTHLKKGVWARGALHH